jgi:hypothetical protein
MPNRQGTHLSSDPQCRRITVDSELAKTMRGSVDFGRRGDLRSATVCFVKVFLGRVARLKRVMEKMENDRTVSHLSHNPGGYGGWSG